MVERHRGGDDHRNNNLQCLVSGSWWIWQQGHGCATSTRRFQTISYQQCLLQLYKNLSLSPLQRKYSLKAFAPLTTDEIQILSSHCSLNPNWCVSGSLLNTFSFNAPLPLRYGRKPFATLSSPLQMDEFISILLSLSKKRANMGALIWSIWMERNNIIFKEASKTQLIVRREKIILFN